MSERVEPIQTGAKVILASTAIKSGIELTTIQTTAPKFIDAEFEKHRMLSSGSSSDRAIPLSKMLAKPPYLPPDVRLNESGMQGERIMNDDEVALFHEDLIKLYGYVKKIVTRWNKVHKQHINRYLLGFSWQDKIVTATEWDNFFNLRTTEAADPAMRMLAIRMKEAMDGVKENKSRQKLENGQWHIPYITERESALYKLSALLKLSSARCARVSYYNHDKSDPIVEKDITLHDDLRAQVHMTPFEHQAHPIDDYKIQRYELTGENSSYTALRILRRLLSNKEGISHIDKDLYWWSGNLRGWIQYRKLLEINAPVD